MGISFTFTKEWANWQVSIQSYDLCLPTSSPTLWLTLRTKITWLGLSNAIFCLDLFAEIIWLGILIIFKNLLTCFKSLISCYFEVLFVLTKYRIQLVGHSLWLKKKNPWFCTSCGLIFLFLTSSTSTSSTPFPYPDFSTLVLLVTVLNQSNNRIC